MNVKKVLDELNITKNTYKEKLKKTKDELGDLVPDEQVKTIALVQSGKTKEIKQKKVEEIINKVNNMDLEEEKVITASKGNSEWDRFTEAIPEPPSEEELLEGGGSGGKQEYYDGLTVQYGVFYKLKLLKPKELPNEWEGKYGTMYIFPVELLGVKPKEMYDEVYTKKEDKIGEPMYEKGKKYALFLGESALGYFKKFWKQTTDNGRPDNREVIYRKKKVGQYTVHKFKET